MKKIFFIALLVFLICPPVFSQEPPITVRSTIETSKVFSGKVASASLANPAEGKKAQIVVKDKNGNTETFEVNSGISITDRDGKISSLKKIREDDPVIVEYGVSKSGVKKAISITLESN